MNFPYQLIEENYYLMKMLKVQVSTIDEGKFKLMVFLYAKFYAL